MDEIHVIYEDNHLLAVNKRASDIVQGDKTGDTPLSDHVKAYIKKKYNKPGEVFTGVIHRLDRPVSGVVIFARTSKALARMNALFRDKLVQKTYWAVVKKSPPQESGVLINYLIKDESKNKSRAYDHEVKGSSRSELTYKLIGKSDTYFLLEIKPLTGRHHQIRVQLSAMGCPIKGDLKYGADRSNKDASIHLHSLRAEFLHPVGGQEMLIVAEPPNDPVWNYFRQLI